MIATLGQYQIKKGLTESQIDQLINYSLEDPDLKYTSDASRFKDRVGFDEFSTHILAYYSLVDESDNLAGIVWFDDFVVKELPKGYGISIAIRLYGQARGKGLALPFAEKAIEDFKTSQHYKSHPNPKLWLAVSPDNSPAIKVYEKIGFKKIGQLDNGKKELMILENFGD